MRVLMGIWIAAMLIFPAGCATYTRPLAAERQKDPEDRNFDAVWDASMKVLRKYYFSTDRRDRRARVITTLPMTGKHFFEFWRRDAATSRDLAESSIQTIYRAAVVTILPAADAAPDGTRTFEPSVRVTVCRSDMPQRQITSTSEAYSMFSLSGGGSSSEYVLYGAQAGINEGIVDLGRDRNLEAKIQAEIRATAGLPARKPPEPAPVESNSQERRANSE